MFINEEDDNGDDEELDTPLNDQLDEFGEDDDEGEEEEEE